MRLTNLIDIQDRYVERWLVAKRRAERKNTSRGLGVAQAAARRQLIRNLRDLDYDDAQIWAAFNDAQNMAHLRWMCGE